MINKYRNEMKKYYQIEGKQTVQSHGYMVFKYTMDLIGVLKGQNSRFGQKLPQVLIDNKEKVLSQLLSFKTIKHYTLWHDIGKPLCEKGG